MVGEKLNSLRDLMKQHGIQAYLIPSTDPHQSEYVPALWQRRSWLSGFTGSAGDLAVTLNSAGLWTDSRYYLQAEQQLEGSGITLFKMGLPDIPSLRAWLNTELNAGDNVGIDPRVFSYDEAKKLQDFLHNRNIHLTAIDSNLVDEIWENQPDFPADPILPHPTKYAGEPIQNKLLRLRDKMAQEVTRAHVLTTLDSIAWLFNIRGRDVQYNPVVISYAIVTEQEAMLFTPEIKVTDELKRHFGNLVEIYDYQEFSRALTKLAEAEIKVWLDPGTVSRWAADILEHGCDLFWKESPVSQFKAIKNEMEIKGFKAAHVRDGVAMAQFLHWLEKTVPEGEVTEVSAAKQVKNFRAEQDLFQGLSFETISSYKDHAAIVHYAATPETDVPIKPEGIYLIDSGGQYLDGTTDITRTIALGEPTAEQKEHFTRILKGHIQLAMTRYPRTTAGNQLDTIARKPLWDIGKNYGHGTGHGIGSFLNVHEGPHAISYYRGIGVELEPGMLISNEPGYYKAGEYGLRVENLILVVKDEEFSGENSEFYKFETITLCPIDQKLMAKSMLTENEIGWLNDYHASVRKTLSPYLKGEELAWLENATKPL